MYEPLVHKIAVVMKDYYVLRTIDDTFVFAGAKRTWLKNVLDDSEEMYGSTRQARVERWVKAIELSAPDCLEATLRSVALQLIENEDIPSGDRAFLTRQIEALRPSARVEALVISAISSHANEALFDIQQHILRITKNVEEDPELAIGSTKELLESVFKIILEQYGENPGTDDFPTLLKRVQKRLSLDPSSIKATKGRDTTKRILSSIGQIVIGIDELRNLYGTGHGQARRSGVSPRHARLVVGTGSSLALFLIETFKGQTLSDD